jgi:hypothetical protein
MSAASTRGEECCALLTMGSRLLLLRHYYMNSLQSYTLPGMLPD